MRAMSSRMLSTSRPTSRLYCSIFGSAAAAGLAAGAGAGGWVCAGGRLEPDARYTEESAATATASGVAIDERRRMNPPYRMSGHGAPCPDAAFYYSLIGDDDVVRTTGYLIP